MKAGMLAQRARIEREARKLAHSGHHSGWRSIERALMSRSLTQVPYVFANAWTRSELDRFADKRDSSAKTIKGARMEDRRRSFRIRTLKFGKILLGVHHVSCTIRNLSEAGACLEVQTPYGIPPKFAFCRCQISQCAHAKLSGRGTPD